MTIPHAEGAPVRASVIVPSWNGAALLPRVLDSLRVQRFGSFEVIVVDNGSEDGSLDLLRTRYPDVRLVSLGSNRGFAGAVNAGLAAARGEIVALLNNDAVADPGWLAALVAALDAHPEVASCASRMLDLHDPRRIDSAGDQLGIFPSNCGHGQLDDERFRQPVYVLSPCAGAAAYRRILLQDLGGFDERFFAYMEDVDLGVRLQFSGYDCLYVPEAVVHHEGARTSDRLPEMKFFLLMRNSLFVFFQYMPPLRRLAWSPVVLARVLLNARRERQEWRAGWRAIWAALSDWPRISARRRAVRRSGLLSWGQFRRRLPQPLAHSGFAAPALGRTAGARRPVPSPGASAWCAASTDEAAVDVVIVNWNGGRYLRGALDALRRSTVEARVVLVDNASGDDSLAVAAAFPELDVVALDTNVGYASGANIGLARGSAPYALVMNPDVLLEPEYLRTLRDRLRAAPRVGAAQGKLYQIESGRFLAGGHPERRLLDSAGHAILPSRVVVDRGQGHPDDPRYDRERTVFSATGAALFLRRAMLGTLSPEGHFFDPAFFAYKEDIDLCWRARLRGWEVLYVPAAVAHHVRSMPGGNRSAWRSLPQAARRHSWKNHYLMMIKNDRARDLLASLPHVLGWEIARLGYAALRDPRVLPAYGQLLAHGVEGLRQRARSLREARRSGVDPSQWFSRRAATRPPPAPSPMRTRDGETARA